MPSERQQDRVREDFRQFVAFALGYGVVLLLGYLLLRKINLTLSEDEMGRYSYAFALINILMPVFYAAAPQAFLRFHADHMVSPILRRRLLPLFFLSALGLALTVGIKTGSPFPLLIAAYPFFNERLFIFRAQMRTLAVNALKTAEIATPLVALYLIPLVPGLRDVITINSNAIIAFYGIGFATAFFFPLKLSGTASPPPRDLFRFLAPVVVTTVVAALIENLTVVMTKSMLGYEAAAQMGVAARNLIFIRALFQVLLMFYPVIYFREMSKGRFGTVRLYRTFLLVLAIGFVATLAVGAPLLYRLTGAEAYVATSRVFIMLAVALLCDFVFEIYGLYFQQEIKTWKATVVKGGTLLLMFGGFSIVALRTPTLLSFAAVVLVSSAVSSLIGIVWAVREEGKAQKLSTNIHERNPE